jgi:hypothetical protein
MATEIVEKQRIADAALDNQLKPAVAREQKTVLEVSEEVDPTDLNEAQIGAAHKAMQMLAGVCDGAEALDDMGFNKFDSAVGKSLAARFSLTQRQAKLAKRLALKYRRQLGQALLDILFK